MYVIRLHAFGPAENLRYETVPDPVPGPGQVRVAVAAAGVHLVDTALRRGEPGPYPIPELPTIPGREVAGTVDRVGADVDPAWLGKPVVAHLGAVPGGYAELAVTDVARLHDIPANLDAAAAVAIIGTGRTTMGILQFTDLGPDDVAIVTAAAGGIGTLLVQYAKNAGATVVGLAGGRRKPSSCAPTAPISRSTTGRRTGPIGCEIVSAGGRRRCCSIRSVARSPPPRSTCSAPADTT